MEAFIIGIDIGGTKLSTAIANNKGEILHNEVIPTNAHRGKKYTIERIIGSINSVIKNSNKSINDIKCIGIGAPGPVVHDKGLVISPPNLPGWKRVPLRDIISKHFNKKTFLENDANCAALAELKFGAGKNSNNFVYVTISTGIGGGIIIDKKLYLGSSGSAGEIGHTVIDINGPKCPCGKIGHLEGIAAGPAITKKYGMSPEKINSLASRGDKKAQKIIIEIGQNIGIGFTNLVNILNPEAIIVGGGISNFGKSFFKSINETVKKEALAKVKIIPAKLKKDVGILGAIALCL